MQRFTFNPVLVLIISVALFAISPGSRGAEAWKVIDLWPGTPPGEKGDISPENDTTKPTDNLIAGKPLIRKGCDRRRSDPLNQRTL